MPWDATRRAVCSEWIGLHWNPIQCNPMANLSGGILRQADVPLTGRHLEFLEAELELLVGFVVAERRDDHAILSGGPVGRRGDAVLRSQLERIDRSQNLVEVPSGGCRVEDGQRECLVRLDDEDGAARHRQTFVVLLDRVEHAVEGCDVPAGVADDGILHLGLAAVVQGLDVLHPGFVTFRVVAAERSDLDAPLVELRLEAGHGSELRRAHRREVRRVGKQNGPRTVNVIVPLDVPGRCVSLEVWYRDAQPQCECVRLPAEEPLADATRSDVPGGRRSHWARDLFPFGDCPGMACLRSRGDESQTSRARWPLQLPPRNTKAIHHLFKQSSTASTAMPQI